ncbi:hypothetical protein [Levilactobacillus bambusae]|uniref:hypothetical protein n=1 Tax=Levilactobacillus bambusae TaxID=2024736 RepID=UPI001402549D|nr:hypothetical protein [Levilactobacillus bambusae]
MDMIHSKFGYEPRAFVNADARLEKWLKQEKTKEKNESSKKQSTSKDGQDRSIDSLI